ncbi:MAG: hypothetical protein HDR01_12495 [Lachnospiraceae bacterium]|nr:hypothetical protein [Lachnospiraceae bacterium]
MRNKRIAVYLYMGLLLATVGCSKSNADLDSSTVDTINFNDVIDSNAEENNSSHQSNKETDNNQSDSSQSQSESEQLQSASELDGSIESIGDNRVVINKTFHPSADTAVSYEDSDKVLVTVYFSEETEFEVWTVKNGGANGDADTEKRQGAFSDLKQDVNINITGNYEGDDFHAKHVIIYNFV